MKKYKIGYTTGVYDMFHIGHLNILKRAKEQCEFLVVGVSTDELVRDYKNKTPIIPFEERFQIVDFQADLRRNDADGGKEDEISKEALK